MKKDQEYDLFVAADDVAVTDTTPPPGEQIWRLVNVTELTPGAYRALLACLRVAG